MVMVRWIMHMALAWPGAVAALPPYPMGATDAAQTRAPACVRTAPWGTFVGTWQTLKLLQAYAMAADIPVYRIGQAATRSGVSAANIRFYEKSGLLAPGARSDNHYRHYSDRDVHQLRFIRLCRTMDMSLDEVRTLLNLDLARPSDCAVANAALQAHIAHVEERLSELRVLQRDLVELRNGCDGSGPKCRIMEALHARADHMARDTPAVRAHRHF
jgi:DNA-binding transcriptional MerR regulator